MSVKLPVELWAIVIANYDHHDRSSLLPLQQASKELYALVTPHIYESISIAYSGSEDLLEWAAAHGAEKEPEDIEHGAVISPLFWEPQVLYTTFPHISIPLHRLPRLHASFAVNPILATYTTSLTLQPFHQALVLYGGWDQALQTGWDHLRNILPFFTNVQRVEDCSTFMMPTDIIRFLPTPSKLTYLRILVGGTIEESISLFKSHPNLEFAGVTCHGDVSENDFTDVVVDLPRLSSLKTAWELWSILSRTLSPASLSALRHLIIGDLQPAPPIATLNNLLSLEISAICPWLTLELAPHLHSIEYITFEAHVMVMATDITSLLHIPSRSLRYVCIRSTLPHSAYRTPSLFDLFDIFPKLAIVDFQMRSSDGESCTVRFLHGRTVPEEVDLGQAEPFQPWWEKAKEEVQLVIGRK